MLHKSTVLAALVCGSLALAGAGLFAWQKLHAGPFDPQAQTGKQDSDPARYKSMNHMKEILIAFHNFCSVSGHFPPPAIYGSDGGAKLSWRVAILPYLGEGALYEEFHLDEPWDSPHNKALIARMPEVFTTPSSPTPAGSTRIRGFEGPNTFFGDRTGITIPTITDGTSNTLAIVAAKDETPWTRPGELSFVPGQVRAVVDNSDEHGVLVGPVDGLARFISGGSEAIWRFFITPAGNEVLRMEAFASWPAETTQPATRPVKLPPATPTPMPTSPLNVQAATSAPAISPDLEARLRAIEAKLDRLIRKLDGDDYARPPQ